MSKPRPARYRTTNWSSYNASLRKRGSFLIWVDMGMTSRATRYYGRAFWKRWTGYRVRSRIEARMRCLKALGETIAARDLDRQTAEI